MPQRARPAHAGHQAHSQPRDLHASLGCHVTLRNPSALGCYVILPPLTRHMANYVKTWRYLQNRKYITYRVVVRRGWSHGHSEHIQKISWNWTCGFLRYASRQTGKQTDKETDIQTYRHADSNTSHVCRKGSKKSHCSLILRTAYTPGSDLQEPSTSNEPSWR